VPGDLRDQEQFQPWYYDSRYDLAQRPFMNKDEITDRIMDVAVDVLNQRITKSLLAEVKIKLDQAGYLNRNPNSPEFLEKIKDILLAGKVVQACLNSAQ